MGSLKLDTPADVTERMIVVTRTSANAKESSGKAKSVSFPMVWTNQRPIDAEADRRLGFAWRDLTLVLNSEPFVLLSGEFLNYSLLCKLSNSQFFLVHPNSWTSFVVGAVHHLIFAWAGSTPFLEPFFHFFTPLKLLFSYNSLIIVIIFVCVSVNVFVVAREGEKE